MAFKMNGSPTKLGTISGTVGHSSALKMKAEENAASALKQVTLSTGKTGPFSEETVKKDKETVNKNTNKKSKTKSDPYAEALKKDSNLPEYVKVQKSTTPGSEEYEANQAKINLAYGKVRSKKLKAAQIKNVEAKKTTETTEKKKKGGKLGKFFKNVSSQLKKGQKERGIFSEAGKAEKKSRKPGESKFQADVRRRKEANKAKKKATTSEVVTE